MAGKRTASTDLNHDNWNNEDSPEEAGSFIRASEDVLKKRVFKTAKRRITKTTEEGSLSVFNPVNLAKFSKTPKSGAQLFGFLSKIQSDVSKTNGIDEKSTEQGDGDKVKSTPMFSFGNTGNQPEKTEVGTNSIFGNQDSTMKKNEEINSTPMFSFGNLNSKINGKSDEVNKPIFTFGNQNKMETPGLPNSEMKVSSTNILVNEEVESSNSSKSEEKKGNSLDDYYAKLKGLNESVAKWINKHVENNPLINLQPIFKDYEKFFNDIDSERNQCKISDQTKTVKDCELAKTESKENALDSKNTIGKFTFSSQSENKVASLSSAATFKFGATTTSSSTSTATPTFKFGAINTTNSNLITSSNTTTVAPSINFVNTNTSTSNNASLFKFTATTTTTNDTIFNSTPKFSFGNNQAAPSNTPFGGFSFNSSSAPLNFGTTVQSTCAKIEENKNDEESDEPPKIDVKQVEEEGHIYTIRCKLFVKKDGTFVEKGIGSLFLKPVPNSDKVQVIVRAHTSLGKVLCNFILSSSNTTTRMGKNNVMVLCIPTPESPPPPVPVLIKVKTGEDADQLLETLEKHKK